MGNKTIKDITDQQTVINSTDWFEIQEDAGTSKKIQYSAMTASFPALLIGESIQYLMSYKPISASFPWFNMSLPDQNWTTANYSSDFIAEMRSRKVIYDEMNTAASSFTGSWSSGVFTLDNNTANTTMLAELAEEYLFAGSPITNWRLLNDGTYDYNVIAISVAARTIEVSTADHTPSGTSISIYLHRVYGSTTSARHHSWAGLGLYMCGGGKISGLRRRDALQKHRHNGSYAWINPGGNTAVPLGYVSSGSETTGLVGDPIDSTSGTIRTDTKTRIESGTVSLYLYVGSYTV